MERETVPKTFNGSLSQKIYNLGKKDACISHLQPDERIADEISIFDAHQYFNESCNSGTHRVSCNTRVSPMFNVNVLNPERISERFDPSAVPSRFSSDSTSVDGYTNGRNYVARSFHTATPTASSEASWNSQTGLLSNPPGAILVSMQNANHDENKIKLRCGSSTANWLFRRKCPCSGKKSVRVKEKAQEPKTPPQPPPARLLSNHYYSTTRVDLKRQNPMSQEKISVMGLDRAANRSGSDNTSTTQNEWGQSLFPSNLHGQCATVLASGRPFSSVDRGAGFTFPILHPSSPSPLKLQVLNGGVSIDEPPRHSLEVFRPSHETLPVVSRSKPSQSFTFSTSPKARPVDDEVASDASSDLFEIESFSTHTTSYPTTYHRGDSPDEASSFDARRLAPNGSFLYTRRSLDEPMTPSAINNIDRTEWYEPSEASIDWSVTTAEGFDRASVANMSMTASELEKADDERMIIQGRRDQRLPEKSKGRPLSASSSGHGLLLSCRSEKAVSVGPNPVKCLFAAEGLREGPPPSVKSTMRHVGSRPPVPNKPMSARSHSARVSLPFAT